MNKYEKLTAALKEARKEALPLGNSEDGGTCNMDKLELYLPRYQEQKTIEAIEAANLRGFKHISRCTGACYLIGPPIGAQGNARTRQVKKMSEVITAHGYDAMVWYQMD